ncbi:MAG: glycosyltransferase family 2 protein [Candidatus Bathyarchaeia archaeon]|nr:glycosyltransferase family 2 protein [Candidatus Bathyarchaeia archaeon]
MKTETEMKNSLKVTVVFPAYNEVDALKYAVDKVTQALNEFTSSYEIIIAEDGSTDGTDKLAEALAEEHPFVKHIHGEKRLGRGRALKNAFRQSSGEILVYMDLDLATDLKHLKALVDAVESEGYEFATGSRMLNESKVKRSGTRHLASKTYNFMVRAVLGSDLRDHQCGFKAFRRESLVQLLDEVGAEHWFWDTEILVRAQRRGFRIKEIPVLWRGGRESKVRLFMDSLNMGWQIFSLWWHLKLQSLVTHSLLS